MLDSYRGWCQASGAGGRPLPAWPCCDVQEGSQCWPHTVLVREACHAGCATHSVSHVSLGGCGCCCCWVLSDWLLLLWYLWLTACKCSTVCTQLCLSSHPTLSMKAHCRYCKGTSHSQCSLPNHSHSLPWLQNGVTLAERTMSSIDFPWAVPNRPMFFYICTTAEEMSGSG